MSIENGIARPDEEGVAKVEGEHQHDDDKNQTGENVVLQVLDHPPDVLALVAENRRFHPSRPFGLVDGDLFLDRIGDLDDIGAGALRYRESHRFPAVDPGEGVPVLEAEGDRRHILDEDGLTTPGLDHELAHHQRIAHFPWHTDGERLRPEIHVTARDGDVLVPDRVHYVRQGQTVLPQFLRIHIDPDLTLEATHQVDLQDTPNALQLVLQILGEILEHHRSHVAGQVDLDDGDIREADLLQDRLFGVGG